MARRAELHKPLSHSKGVVNRAGEELRSVWTGASPIAPTTEEAIEVLADFRMAHAYPLQMVASSLRYHVGRRCVAGDVGQRLKRLPTIIDKLARHPEMALARMQDIGGCRAVVADEADLRLVLRHLRKSNAWNLIGDGKDYIASPKPDGYRAFHLVVEKEGRAIEIQLRTQANHDWAELVESVDRRHGLGLKVGRASADVQEYFRLGADMIAAREAGETPDPVAVARFRQLHASVGSDLI